MCCFFLGQICLLRPRGCRLAFFLHFSSFSRSLKFPNVSRNGLVPSWNFSEHFGINFTPPEQFSPFFWWKMLWKYNQKACVFKLFLLRHWSKTAQARVFHSKIISTRRTITIRFPTHSMEPGKCFKKLQRGHRWRRRFSKGKTSREVTWGLLLVVLLLVKRASCSTFSQKG